MYIRTILTPRQASFINKLVLSGIFLTISDALRHALRTFLGGEFQPPKHQHRMSNAIEVADVQEKISVTISISGKLDAQVKAAISDGEYATAAEVMRAALNALIDEMQPRRREIKNPAPHSILSKADNHHSPLSKADKILVFKKSVEQMRESEQRLAQEAQHREAERLKRMGCPIMPVGAIRDDKQ